MSGAVSEIFAHCLPCPLLHFSSTSLRNYRLATSLHGIEECGEHQMLVEHLDRLSSDDLLLDRGYPSRWLVALLNDALFRSACGWRKPVTAASPACARFCAAASRNRSSRSMRHRGATPPTTSLPAHPSRSAWCATSRRTARCAC